MVHLPKNLISNYLLEKGNFVEVFCNYTVAHQHVGSFPPLMGEKYMFNISNSTFYLFSLPTGSPMPNSMKSAVMNNNSLMKIKYEFMWRRYGIDFPLNDDKPTFDALLQYYTQKTGHSIYIYQKNT
jgi:hypothetical protein